MSVLVGSQHLKAEQAPKVLALVGNPNCGKSTLFNALTGSSQRVGNWPGVTVERKSGFFAANHQMLEVIDLPGMYALTADTNQVAMDEGIGCEFILKRRADLILNIVDVTHLERHLYLTTQLIELDVPFILALNMMDVAHSRGLRINTIKLAESLGCQVLALSAKTGDGLTDLKCAALNEFPVSTAVVPYPAEIEQAILTLMQQHTLSRGDAIRLLENNLPNSQEITRLQQAIQQQLGEEVDILIADARYRFIQTLITNCVSTSPRKQSNWTARIDKMVLNRFLSLPIFIGVMYLLFVFAINVGGAFQDFFDISSQTIFVDGFAYLLTQLHAPNWLIAVLANGLGKGINTTLAFIPVIGAMFLFLALLEDIGYMARAAFVVDRFMRFLGLPGKAFIPMIVGFGCNVPAIMGARTLQNERDRILTVMMSPFMSCSARLAIFAVFTSAFFPHGGQNIVFALYLIGIGMAILTGFILRQTLLRGDPSPLIMELPPYHIPQIKDLCLHAWQRLRGFVIRAGKLIVPICLLIGALNTLNIDASLNDGEGSTQSLLSLVGQWLTPIFEPMGIHANNWPATVGLVTGVLAKEVVVGTLNTLYTQMGHFVAANADSFQFWGGLKNAFQSIPTNLASLGDALTNPILAKAPIDTLQTGVYGLMAERFDGKAGAFAYLLFVLLYFPCVSTLAVMLKELHRGWSIFAAGWMTGVAYGAAVLFYQVTTWANHPFSSSMWILGIASFFFGTLFFMRTWAKGELK